MRINKKEDLRTSLPYNSNDKFMNIKNIKEKRGLINSLSMNNLYQYPGTKREFGKEITNIIDLTVNQNNFEKNENIEEKIKYYRKINDYLTNMLNNYDKTFFDKKRKIEKKIVNLNINIQNNESNEKYFFLNFINVNNKKNIKNENKENIDKNIFYLQNSIENKYHKIVKKNGDNYMDKIVKINAYNKGNKIDKKKAESHNNNKQEIKDIINPLEKGSNDDVYNYNNKDNNIIEISDIKNNSYNNNNNLSKREEHQKISNINSILNNNNPQEVDEYFKEIFCDMQLKENTHLVDPNYLKNTQKTINQKMRAILIDWIVDVHKKYKLKPETLYLTVNIIDRFLSKQ